jgi:hypothetical protein
MSTGYRSLAGKWYFSITTGSCRGVLETHFLLNVAGESITNRLVVKYIGNSFGRRHYDESKFA